MHDFLKNILSSAIGVVLAIFMLIGSLLIIVAISGLINLIFNSHEKIEPNSVVKLKIDFPISDKPNTDPFANFTPFGEFEPNNSIHLYKVLEDLRLASENKNAPPIEIE